MKKTIIRLTSFIVLVVLLGTSAIAITGSYNNYSNPKKYTLSASYGCGNNQIGLYIDDSVDNYGATQDSEYKWELLTGSNDIIVACNSVIIDVTNNVIVAPVTGLPAQSTVADHFYGYNMTTSSFHTIPSNSASTSHITLSVRFTYKTKITEPFFHTTIIDATFSHDTP